MNSASMEWVARVAVRNEIETAKAMRGLRAVPLSAGGTGSAGRGGRDGTESEVAK